VNKRRAVHRQEDGSLGTILALVGCVGLLAATFGAGVFTGRYWGRPPVIQHSETGESVRTVRQPPRVTFYQELVAPLYSPLPADPRALRQAQKSSGSRPEASRSDVHGLDAREKLESPPSQLPPGPLAAGPELPRRPGRPAGVERPDVVAVAGRGHDSGRPDESGGRFTVQVGAFTSRDKAEAARTAVHGAGHEAYIDETVGASSARFRVRVGSFATREAARELALRLETSGGGRTYVTLRSGL
jgi:cell division septation protein DedD